MKDHDLTEVCVGCGSPRAEHRGKYHEGGCPGSKGRDGSRFKLGIVRPPAVRTRPLKRPLPGNGPWLILPECPAELLHNTANSTRGKNGEQPCICPRAEAALEAERVAKAKRVAARRGKPVVVRRPRDTRKEREAQRVTARFRRMIHKPQESDIPSPDFSGGLCSKPFNVKIADKGFDARATRHGIANRQEAKNLCSFCPLQTTVCGPYVLAAESPRGSWGGVWAGLDPWERMGKRMVILDETVELVDDSTAMELLSMAP